MGKYFSKSRGKIDASTLPYNYLRNALDKARKENNLHNIQVLEEELNNREGTQHLTGY